MNYSIPLENSLISGVFNFLFCQTEATFSNKNDMVLNQPRYDIKELKNQSQVQVRFSELAKQWQEETIDYSSLNEILKHKAYLAIIALGRPAIHLILNELERSPHFWFTALESILIASNEEANPVDEADYGNLRKMTDAWLSWGKEKRYLY